MGAKKVDLNDVRRVGKQSPCHFEQVRLPLWHVIAAVQLLDELPLLTRRCFQNGPVCTCSTFARVLSKLSRILKVSES